MKEIFTKRRTACAKRAAINYDKLFGTEIAKQLPFDSLYDAYRYAVKMGGIDGAMESVGFEKIDDPQSGDIVIMKSRKTYVFGIVSKSGKLAIGEYNTSFIINSNCTCYRKVYDCQL